MAEEVPDQGKPIWLVVDNASWHHSKALDWHHIKPLHLPPYSPDFNPIERLWQPLKSQYLAGFVTKRSEELADKLEVSIKQLLSLPETLQSVCRTHRDERQKILAKGLTPLIQRPWNVKLETRV